jgi:beta-lactam-binding protein with PASTA domain
MSFFGFLLKKKFYLHLGIAIVLTIVLFLAVIKFFDYFTHHGEAYIVPDFSGSTLLEVIDQNFDEVFDFIVIDSVFDNERLPGEIVLQNPSPGSKVKKGRNIYVTVVAFSPEMTIMPELKDLTLRQAISLLRSRGIGIRTLEYESYMAENAVFGQHLNEDTLEAGTEIEKGSKIDLVLGKGRNQPVPVPFLIGMLEEKAKNRINLSSFNIGRIYHLDEPARQNSRVYRQEPAWDEEERSYRGDYINIWLRSDLYFDFDSLIEELRPDTTAVDTALFVVPDSIDFQDIE